MNGRVGGPEKQLAALFESKEPRILVLDHAECLLEVEEDATENEAPLISIKSPTIERKMYLLWRDYLDRLLYEAQFPFFLVVIVDSFAQIPQEMARPGRLFRKCTVSIASRVQRRTLLQYFLSSLPFASEVERLECVEVLSGQPTSGLTIADLEGLIRRVLRGNKEKLTLTDFLAARSLITPTSITGGACLRPKAIPFMVGLEHQRSIIDASLSSIFSGREAPRGILLHGPSGCGKSLLASTLASFSISPQHRLPISFIAVDSASLLSKYFGQSERNLAQVFADARAASPCILFFDQIDVLAAKRNISETGNSDRLLTTFLVEMDGFARKQANPEEDTVIVLGTTSKLKALDSAMLRPGRLDLHVELPLPAANDRFEYIQSFLSQNRGFKLTIEQVEQLVSETENFTYADLESLFREAGLTALRSDINCEIVEFRHFNE